MGDTGGSAYAEKVTAALNQHTLPTVTSDAVGEAYDNMLYLQNCACKSSFSS